MMMLPPTYPIYGSGSNKSIRKLLAEPQATTMLPTIGSESRLLTEQACSLPLSSDTALPQLLSGEKIIQGESKVSCVHDELKAINIHPLS